MGMESKSAESKMRHAGREEGSLNLIAFENKEELVVLLNKAGCSVEEDGRIRKKDDSEAVCSSCKEPIKVDNVGHVLPGSQYFYCDKSVCIIDYLERFE